MAIQRSALPPGAAQPQPIHRARSSAVPASSSRDRSACHRDYARWRARQIAYGRWQPWADAELVRQHVLRLRCGGASYRDIARAADVSPMTVHNLVNGCRARNLPAPSRIGSTYAHQILVVTPDTAGVHRRNACGSRRRLQALVALGHSPAHLARQLGISPPRMRRLLHGQTQTVSSATQLTVCKLYSQLWDELPAERTRREQITAEAARCQAHRSGWPPPMALDDDRIDDPTYRPRAAWRRATA